MLMFFELILFNSSACISIKYLSVQITIDELSNMTELFNLQTKKSLYTPYLFESLSKINSTLNPIFFKLVAANEPILLAQ